MKRIGLVTALALAACGGSSDGGSGGGARSERDAFIGVWSGSGQVTMTLASPLGQTPADLPVEGTLVIVPGEAPDALIIADPSGCVLRATVAGAIASVEPGTKCASNQGSATTTLHLDRGTATLDGDSLELESEGSAEVSSLFFQGQGSYRATSLFVRQGE